MMRTQGTMLAAVAAAAILAAGCGGGGDDQEVICVGGCPAQGVTKVDSISVHATGLSARHEITESDGRVWGEADTVSLAISSAAGVDWSGTMQTGDGTNYGF